MNGAGFVKSSKSSSFSLGVACSRLQKMVMSNVQMLMTMAMMKVMIMMMMMMMMITRYCWH